MGFFSAAFTTRIARSTTFLINNFTPMFDPFGDMPNVFTHLLNDNLINDSYVIGYMQGAMGYVFEVNNIKDSYDQNIAFSMFFDHIFGDHSIKKLTGNNGQNTPSNPIFANAVKLGYKEMSVGFINNNSKINLSLREYISEKYNIVDEPDDMFKPPTNISRNLS